MKSTPRYLVAIVFFAGLIWEGCGPIAGELGSACVDDSNCASGACLKELTGGYCSQRCEEAACPGESRCAALTTGSFCLQHCETSLFDCREGYHCAEVGAGSVCFPDCTIDADCGGGASCIEKRCEVGAAGPVGAACRVNAGCATGRCEVSFNGGYCTAPCPGRDPTAANQGCPTGSTCGQLSEAAGLCLLSCGIDTACRPDYFCETANGAGTCRPRCRGSTNCPVGFTCDVAGGGRCIEGSALPRQTGARCAQDPDCDSNYCLNEADQQFPGGICAADCSDDASLCGSTALCITPSDPAVASVCLQRCANNFECRADYFCSPVTGSAERVCVPRCTAVPLCHAPEVCDVYSGDCVAPGTAAASRIERVALGTLSQSGQAQSQQHFELDVPSDALSFTVVMKGRVGGTSAIARLLSPSGEVLFDLNSYLTSKVRILPVNDGDFGMLYPNSPRAPFPPGRYSFDIINESGSRPGEVFALLKRSSGGGPATGGELNLNLWFAGVPGVNAASAAGYAPLQQMLTELRSLYASAGISIGDIAYFDLPAAAASTFAVIDSVDGSDSELRRLFEYSQGAPNNAMNFFLVNEIRGGEAGFTILGVSGGIPGIPFEQGTNQSGVAVTTLDLAQDPASVARTMAHEGGHWLGLWHTTEQNGQMHDPLADTDECPASRDSNGDDLVTSDECAGTGAENLMFWQAGPTASHLTGNQGFVLLKNPVLGSP